MEREFALNGKMNYIIAEINDADFVSCFNDGVALVRKIDGEIYFIDTTGRRLI